MHNLFKRCCCCQQSQECDLLENFVTESQKTKRLISGLSHHLLIHPNIVTIWTEWKSIQPLQQLTNEETQTNLYVKL